MENDKYVAFFMDGDFALRIHVFFLFFLFRSLRLWSTRSFLPSRNKLLVGSVTHSDVIYRPITYAMSSRFAGINVVRSLVPLPCLCSMLTVSPSCWA